MQLRERASQIAPEGPIGEHVTCVFLLRASIEDTLLIKNMGRAQKMKSILLTFFKFLGIEMRDCLRLLCAAILKQ
jgi:hypothetical protein